MFSSALLLLQARRRITPPLPRSPRGVLLSCIFVSTLPFSLKDATHRIQGLLYISVTSP